MAIASGGCKGCAGTPAEQFAVLPKYKLTYPDSSAQTAFTQAEVAAKVAAFKPYGPVEVQELASKPGEPVRYGKVTVPVKGKTEAAVTEVVAEAVATEAPVKAATETVTVAVAKK